MDKDIEAFGEALRTLVPKLKQALVKGDVDRVFALDFVTVLAESGLSRPTLGYILMGLSHIHEAEVIVPVSELRRYIPEFGVFVCVDPPRKG